MELEASHMPLYSMPDAVAKPLAELAVSRQPV
jgi:hypothetical protein